MSKRKFLLMFIGVIVVDQATKWWFMERGGVINSGGVFGIMPGIYWTGIIFGVLTILSYYLLRLKDEYDRAGLTLIVASGWSNVVDRLVFGGVRDFIFWPIINIYGNIADVLLSGGMVVLLYNAMVIQRKKK